MKRTIILIKIYSKYKILLYSPTMLVNKKKKTNYFAYPEEVFGHSRTTMLIFTYYSLGTSDI